jgi:hypothetical protein
MCSNFDSTARFWSKSLSWYLLVFTNPIYYVCKIKRELQYSDGSISDLENKAFFAVVFIMGIQRTAGRPCNRAKKCSSKPISSKTLKFDLIIKKTHSP